MALFSKEQNEAIKFLMYGISQQGGWKYNPETDLVDVWGNFSYTKKGLKDFKGVKFGKINGDFDCSNNELASLEGAPIEVEGSFNCSNNKLTSLEGAPIVVEGSFNCSNNKLTSLEGAPRGVHKFNCSGNLLTGLDGGPDIVSRGEYKCSKNKLTSLKGLTTTVDPHFGLEIDCSDNKLKSLETIGDTDRITKFICRKNEIISLNGAPLIKYYNTGISYHGNKGSVSGKTLELIHFTMSSKKVSYFEALGMLKTQIKAADLKKLMSQYENGDDLLKGASLLGRFA